MNQFPKRKAPQSIKEAIRQDQSNQTDLNIAGCPKKAKRPKPSLPSFKFLEDEPSNDD